MKLDYDGKRSEKEILHQTLPAELEIEWNDQPNKLIHGENLSVLKYLLETQESRLKNRSCLY